MVAQRARQLAMPMNRNIRGIASYRAKPFLFSRIPASISSAMNSRCRCCSHPVVRRDSCTRMESSQWPAPPRWSGPTILPHVSGHPLETVRAAAPQGPGWYQLSKIGGPLVADAAVDRAAAAGFEILVLTIDNDGPMRERDVRNGVPPLFGGIVLDMFPHLPQL